MSPAHHVKVGLWDDRLQFLSLFSIYDSLHYHVYGAGYVFLKQCVQILLLLWQTFCINIWEHHTLLPHCRTISYSRRPVVHPFLPVGGVAEIFRVHKNHSTARYRCRRSVLQIADLKANICVKSHLVNVKCFYSHVRKPINHKHPTVTRHTLSSLHTKWAKQTRLSSLSSSIFFALCPICCTRKSLAQHLLRWISL